jgi:prolyl 4-hydroxylase
MLIEAGFLSEAELVKLVNLIRKYSRPAPQQNWGLGECGSSTAALSQLGDHTVALIEDRLNDALGYEANCAEGLRGVKYEPGQGYRIHHDAFSAGNEAWDEFGGARGNRVETVMIYLNTLTGGGATVFPELGVRIEPRGGMMVAWHNLKADRSIDMDVLHAAEPHRAAEKFIVTQWFRELPA